MHSNHNANIFTCKFNYVETPYECFLFFLCAENGGPFIDQVLVLQNYAEGWTDGKWEEKVDERPCIEKMMYSKDKQGYYR